MKLPVNHLREVLAGLANAVVEADDRQIPGFRFDGEKVMSVEDVSVAMGISTIEAKARIRRVRTAAGARKYNQPIGSVITTDIEPVAITMPKSFQKTSYWARNRTHSDPDRGYTQYDLQHEERFTGTMTYDPKRPTMRRYEAVVEDKKTKQREYFEGVSFDQIRLKFENYRDRVFMSESMRRVKPDSEERFIDSENWGTYGKDYWFETEDEQNLPYWEEDDLKARRQIAMHHTKSMGIEIDQSGDSYTDATFNIHPKNLEIANEYFSTFEQARPGFLTTLTKVGSSKSAPNALAYNTIAFSKNKYGLPDAGGDYTTAIYWNPNYFGEKNVSLKQRAEEGVQSGGQEARQWWSNRWSVFSGERYSHMDDMQKNFLVTTVHEVGHTVARVVAFDELTGPRSKSSLSSEDRDYYKQMFWWDVSTIMENYGLGDADNIYEVMTQPYSNKGSLTLNEQTTQNVLSKYGAHSLHEMLAEVWAEYELDPEPRPFAAEVGRVMETVLGEWLYWNTGEQE